MCMNPGEDVRHHEAGLRGSCERPNVDTEKQTQVLWKYIKGSWLLSLLSSSPMFSCRDLKGSESVCEFLIYWIVFCMEYGVRV